MENSKPSVTPLLTVPQAARALSVCRRTVENLITRRSLAVIRIGKAVRIESDELARFKDAHRREAIA